jgi:hypothetical protein
VPVPAPEYTQAEILARLGVPQPCCGKRWQPHFRQMRFGFGRDGYGDVDECISIFPILLPKPLYFQQSLSESKVKFTPGSGLIPLPLTLLFYACFKPWWHSALNKGAPPGRDPKATGSAPEPERRTRKSALEGDWENGAF